MHHALLFPLQRVLHRHLFILKRAQSPFEGIVDGVLRARLGELALFVGDALEFFVERAHEEFFLSLDGLRKFLGGCAHATKLAFQRGVFRPLEREFALEVVGHDVDCEAASAEAAVERARFGKSRVRERVIAERKNGFEYKLQVNV